MNPIDVNYRKLRTTIVPLEAYRAEFDLISKMVKNTQSNEFKFRVELDEIFEVEREGEAERFAPFRSLPHHRLVWHGSRTANYIGILSQGLRIAPPEAPVTGYFLGKGIYLADMVSVSAQYCRIKKGEPTQHAYLLLCDAALGRAFQISHGKFVSKEDLDENEFHSVKCCGTKGPRAGYDVTTPDGLIASLGKEGPTGVPVSELIHNEIVVYDPAQIMVKYLIKLRFTFPPELEVAPSASASTSSF
jgi:poly [ADP-ribose] polymerase 1